MKGMETENIEIVGIDFGHGETALARLSSSTDDYEPEMIEIFGRKTQITALAYKADRGDLIGDQALKTTGITELHIGFKPLSGNLQSFQHQGIIKRFIRKYLDILEETGQIRGRELTLFIVGTPSGWSNVERTIYADLLKQAGMKRVKVEKESRGAFLQIKESKNSEVHSEMLMKNVLIIDIGSSTTDFTVVSDMEARPLEDFGLDLGASLIEEMIFERTMMRMEKENPDEKKRLVDIFEQFPHFLRQCLIACREGKEKYFSIPEIYLTKDQPVDCSLKFRTMKPAIEFEPLIYKDEIEKILNLPIKSLGCNWKDAFRQALLAAKKKLGETEPNLVILTGGASRMYVVLDISREVFPEPQRITRGLEPEFTIAKGLARIGRIDILSEELKKSVEDIENSRHLRELLEQKIPELIESIAEPLADEFIFYAIAPSLRAWRDGYLRTLNDIRPDIENSKKRWLDSIRGEEARRRLDIWLNNTLLPGLAGYTDPLCKKFDIPRSVLDLRNRNIAAGVNSFEHPAFDPDLLIRSDEVIIITSMIAGIFAGMASGGAGLAVFHLPLAGQVIAAIAGAIIAGFGVEAVTEEIKKRDLPVFSRKWVLSDDRMENIIKEQRAKLLNTIKEQMCYDFTWKKKLMEDILSELKKVLNNQVEKAVMWIR